MKLLLYYLLLTTIDVTNSISLAKLDLLSVNSTQGNNGTTVRPLINESSLGLGQSVDGEDGKAWKFDPDYPIKDQEAFRRGSYSLGVPKGHSCVEQSFTVLNGRLICTETTTKGVMCLATCKKRHFLQTGYEADSSMSMMGVYICHPNSMFWTDLKNNKLPLPNPRCVLEEEFLQSIIKELEDTG